MAAIIRVKRRISDGPLENIVLSCKKNRLSENVNTPDEETVTTELKFAGTVVDKTDAVSQHIRKAIRKDKLEKEYKRHACQNPTDRSRTISQTSSKKNRYFVVSKYRSPELDKIDSVSADDETISQKTEDAIKETETDPVSDKLYVLYDVEQDAVPITANPQHKDVVTCNSVPMESEKVQLSNTNREYVYDIYYTNRTGFDYRWLESSSSIELHEQIFMDDRLSDSDEYVGEDSDSNDENNWRNDYPDEDPHFYDPPENNSDDDEDYGGYENFGLDSDDEKLANMLSQRIERCFLDDEDEEEEEREYDKHLDSGDDDDDTHSMGKEPDIGGRSYEQYKKDMLKEMNGT